MIEKEDAQDDCYMPNRQSRSLHAEDTENEDKEQKDVN